MPRPHYLALVPDAVDTFKPPTRRRRGQGPLPYGDLCVVLAKVADAKMVAARLALAVSDRDYLVIDALATKAAELAQSALDGMGRLVRDYDGPLT